jgi:hypothetical protein
VANPKPGEESYGAAAAVTKDEIIAWLDVLHTRDGMPLRL